MYHERKYMVLLELFNVYMIEKIQYQATTDIRLKKCIMLIEPNSKTVMFFSNAYLH